MTTDKTFSVVIPTLREEKRIHLLLEDLVRQQHAPYEVIIVDGYSEDKTVQVINRYKKKIPIKLLFSKIRNPGYQMNVGTRKAHGEYIVFLGADARIPLDFLSKIAWHLQDGTPLLATWNQADTNHLKDRLYMLFYNLGLELLKHWFPTANGSGLVMKRTIFQQLNGFDSSIHFAEDQDIVRRAFKLGYKIKIVRDPKIVWCLRRFRKEGYLKTFWTFIYLYYFHLFQRSKSPGAQKYLMGGTLDS